VKLFSAMILICSMGMSSGLWAQDILERSVLTWTCYAKDSNNVIFYAICSRPEASQQTVQINAVEYCKYGSALSESCRPIGCADPVSERR
jgi:hypothetical protein